VPDPLPTPAFRRRWLSVAVMGIVLAAGGVLASCSSKSPSTATTSTSTTAAPSTTVAPTTPPGPATGFPTNEAAANHLIDAWKAGDRAGAAQGATADAVTTMFTVPVGPLNVRGCDAGEFDTSSCVYRVLSNQYELKLDLDKQANGWVVSHVSYSPPS
jgi:hypothetical protein